MDLTDSVDAGDHDALARTLERSGWCAIAGFPAPAETAALRGDLVRLRETGALRDAAVGRGAGRAQRAEIRGDATLWLDDPRCNAMATAFLAQLDALRSALDRRLFLGLRSVEAHYAAYPPGAGYARHRDRFRDSDARVVSLVAYLNDDWQPAHGGALRLHADDGVHDILPHGGTAVCFLSELAHEVLPATRERLSIAAWMRRDQNPSEVPVGPGPFDQLRTGCGPRARSGRAQALDSPCASTPRSFASLRSARMVSVSR